MVTSEPPPRVPPPPARPGPSPGSPFHCRGCGYELTRIRATRCPECGRPFDPFREATIGRGRTPLARWWHRQRHPDYGGFLPEAITRRLSRMQDRRGHVALGGGLLLPLLPAWIGGEAILTRSTWLPAYRGFRRLEIMGGDAVILGTAWLCLAAAVHLALFWGRTTFAWRVAQPASIVLGIAATVGLLITIWRAFEAAFS